MWIWRRIPETCKRYRQSCLKWKHWKNIKLHATSEWFLVTIDLVRLCHNMNMTFHFDVLCEANCTHYCLNPSSHRCIQKNTHLKLVDLDLSKNKKITNMKMITCQPKCTCVLLWHACRTRRSNERVAQTQVRNQIVIGNPPNLWYECCTSEWSPH